MIFSIASFFVCIAFALLAAYSAHPIISSVLAILSLAVLLPFALIRWFIIATEPKTVEERLAKYDGENHFR